MFERSELQQERESTMDGAEVRSGAVFFLTVEEDELSDEYEGNGARHCDIAGAAFSFVCSSGAAYFVVGVTATEDVVCASCCLPRFVWVRSGEADMDIGARL
jgi:hypothetical protein